MTRPRLISAAAALAALAAAAPASADTLIGVTDEAPSSFLSVVMSDTQLNAAVGWSQTRAATGVSVRVGVLDAFPDAGPSNWWITTALGPGATAADLVAFGTFTPPVTGGSGDFDLAPMTVLATGLVLGPGDYWLVLDGAATESILITNWLGDTRDRTAVALAPGFTLGDFSQASAPTPFGPAATFTPLLARLAFGLDGTVATVPEPTTWTAMLLGFGLLGATLRRRRLGLAQVNADHQT